MTSSGLKLAVTRLVALTFTCATAMAVAATPDLQGVWQVDAGATLRPVGGGAVPLSAEGKTLYDRNQRAIAAGDRSIDLTARCASPGAPRIMLLPYPFEILQQPDHIVFLFQWNQVFRQLVMTGLRDEYVLPSAMGYSLGHWQNDSLLVETTDFANKTFLDSTGLPHSDHLKLTERLHLLRGGKQLEWRLTVDDPQMYTRPWEALLRFARLPRVALAEDVCLDRVEAGRPAIESPAQRRRQPSRSAH
jgi:hypothetical protein